MLKVKIKKRLGGSDRKISSQSDDAPGAFMLDVEFDAPPGVTILFGASGSGKTTTLRAIAGIVRPDSGRIVVGDRALFDSSQGIDLPIRERGVGYVFQNLALFPHLSALGNVEFGQPSVPRGERQKRAMELMAALSIEHTAHRKPRDISGGEAQRVALARALFCRPQILLLDEPLSAIDEATKLGIIADLKAINRQLRLPIVYVTHSREEAVTLGERVIVYERGRVTSTGEPLEVFGSPVTASIARLTGVENIFEGRVMGKNEAGGTMSVEVTDGGGVCRLDVPFGREAAGQSVKVAVQSGDILLATEEPRSTSARNILCGRIATIEDKGNRTLVRVASGVMWNVSVTRQAVEELKLSAGQDVWLAVKTHSCYVLDDE
ncbi:MAG: molybdenum ABC transporter ATP-binding protein [Blastocatellia bacterium]|nr:molybdenum ABC transporter ATP-binding protein [Blastocatellia bacterium]